MANSVYGNLGSALFVGALALACPSCQAPDTTKDSSANGTMRDLAVLTDEIVETVREASDKRVGVAEGQRLLDANKAELGLRMKKLIALPNSDLGGRARAHVAKTIVESSSKMANLEHELRSSALGDESLTNAVDKLVAEHQAMLRGE